MPAPTPVRPDDPEWATAPEAVDQLYVVLEENGQAGEEHAIDHRAVYWLGKAKGLVDLCPVEVRQFKALSRFHLRLAHRGQVRPRARCARSSGLRPAAALPRSSAATRGGGELTRGGVGAGMPGRDKSRDRCAQRRRPAAVRSTPGRKGRGAGLLLAAALAGVTDERFCKRRSAAHTLLRTFTPPRSRSSSACLGHTAARARAGTSLDGTALRKQEDVEVDVSTAVFSFGSLPLKLSFKFVAGARHVDYSGEAPAETCLGLLP